MKREVGIINSRKLTASPEFSEKKNSRNPTSVPGIRSQSSAMATRRVRMESLLPRQLPFDFGLFMVLCKIPSSTENKRD